MSAADALLLKPQFSGIVAMVMAATPLEFAQLFGNELFYYYWPNATDWQTVAAAWGWMGGFFFGALLLMPLLASLMTCAGLYDSRWRMHLYTLLWLPALIQYMLVLQATVTYYYPENYPSSNRLKWYGIMLAITAPAFWLLCTVICEWGEAQLRKLDEMFLTGPPPQPTYTPVRTQ